MARPVMMGLGAAGALSAAAVTGLAYLQADKAPPSARAALASAIVGESVCIKSNVRLVEGMQPACYDRPQFEAMRDRQVIAADGTPVRVALAHPTDAAMPAESAATCAEYDSLVAEGWAALTGADLRREEYFRRACGALDLLVKARPAALSHFANGRAAVEDVRSMADADAIGFGEVEASAPVAVADLGDGVWKLTIGQGETMVYEIAHADFTGDGVGEILAYLTVGAVGGTARTGTIGLIEKTAADGPCGFSPR